jgi:hypothetical protein
MKKSIFFLILVFLSFSYALDAITKTYSLSNFTFSEEKGYTRIKHENMYPILLPGHPELPVQYFTYIIPSDRIVQSVNVTISEPLPVDGSYLIYPAQQVMGDSLTWVEPDSEIYSSESLYPGKVVEIIHQGILDCARLVTIAVYPIQYLPSSGFLCLYPNIEFTFNLTPCNLPEIPEIRDFQSQKVYDYLITSIVDNPDDVNAFYQKPVLTQPCQIYQSYSAWPYVIITTPEFVSAFEPLRQWFIKRGLQCKIVTTSWIFANFIGCDEAERVREYLKFAHRREGAVWILLGGDDDFVPLRYAYDLPVTTQPPLYDQYPCDLYFSDLTGNWNLDGDQVWGEPGEDDPDYYPEVFVGRVLPRTPDEVNNYLNKLFVYEKNPINSELLNHVFWQYPSHDQYYPAQVQAALPYYPSNYTHHLMPDLQNTNGVAASALSIGYGWLNIYAHSCPLWWHTSYPDRWSPVKSLPDQYFDDLSELTNNQKYYVVYMLACWAAAFDKNWLPGNDPRDTILADGFLDAYANKGAVAFSGDAREGPQQSYWHIEFIKALLGLPGDPNNYPHIGLAEAWSKVAGPPSWGFRYTHNFFGSPEMKVWTANNPPRIMASHPQIIPVGTNTNFSIYLYYHLHNQNPDEQIPLPNAYVCLYKENDLYACGYTDGSGRVTFTISPRSIGTLYVTATKTNFLPYEGSCQVRLLPIAVESRFATSFPQGRHLVRTSNTKDIYMTFESEGKIYLSLTTDEGENWNTEEIDEGLYPCIGLNCKGLPWIAFTKYGDLICKMKRPDGSWKEMLIYDGNENLWAGPPSMALATMPIKEDVIDYAYITYPIYEGTMPDGPREQPPPNTHSYIYISLFDTTGVNKITNLIDEGKADMPVSHPCVGVTPVDYIHIAWQQKDEIWYITNMGKVTPENWQNVQWTPKYDLSNTEGISEHPFVESYGDIVYVIWKEGTPGEIIRKQRYAWEPSEYDKWKNPENLSNSPELNSDYPQMSAGYVTIWQEEGEGHNYKVYANILDNVSCLTPEANDVNYAHTNVLIVDPKIPEYTIYYCYTDEITENELYEVKFDKYEYAPESGEGEGFVYYDGKVGNDSVSPYCVTRTGNIDYGDYSIDYGSQLEYLLKYLDPCKYYQLQAVVYQDTTGTIRQSFEVEDTLEATVRVYPTIPETINISISPNSYKEDLEAGLEILRTRGPFASVADFKLYEYEVVNDSGSGGSGPQGAAMVKLPIPTMLQAPTPNPFTNLTQIRFQIPAKTKVDLKVYNSTGRLVNTLISDELNAGYYNMTWTDKDMQERVQSNGIYFIRLKTNDYDATKKMVLVR